MELRVPLGKNLILSVLKDVLDTPDLQSLKPLYFGNVLHFIQCLIGVVEMMRSAIEETGSAEIQQLFIYFCEFD